MKNGIVGALAGCFLLVAWGVANADWQLMGSPVNSPAAGQSASVAVGGSAGNQSLYIAFDQFGGGLHRVFVYRWNGAAWEASGNVLNFNQTEFGEVPSLAIGNNNQQFVGYLETNGYGYCVFPKRLNGSAWETLGDTTTGMAPSDFSSSQNIVMATDHNSPASPFVAWSENYTIQVQRWTGLWNNGYGSVAINHATRPTHDLVIDNTNKPFLTWYTYDGSSNPVIHVRSWNGTTPSDEPDVTFQSSASAPYGWDPSFMNDSTQGLYLTFLGTNLSASCIMIYHYNGATWSAEGTYSDIASTTDFLYTPRLAMDSSHNLYAAWIQHVGAQNQIRVKKRTGTTWTNLGGSLNVTTDQDASNPYIKIVNDTPMAVWEEYDATGTTKNIYAKQWLVATATPTVTPTQPPGTPVPTFTATPDLKRALNTEEIAAFPNPARTRVNFAFNCNYTGDVSIRVYNTHFRLVKEIKDATSTGLGSIAWDVSDVSPGIYFYQIVIGSHKFPNQKLVISR